ncbi:hypothetical protein KUTeg_000136 [Tegillarca granosa]|uniref:Nuclease HARBI1 n=1 Tax=Tegillarca granosa TaxID=220873 RepID=A0ABQ9FWQ1_TEGGR|nr:hypothetical protein KUTeg_000136 [Tegillarca granosa]
MAEYMGLMANFMLDESDDDSDEDSVIVYGSALCAVLDRLSLKTTVLIALRYLGHQENVRLLSNIFNVSDSSVIVSRNRVVFALLNNEQDRYIQWPIDDNMKTEVIRNFRDKRGFSGTKHIETVNKIVIASCILHNLSISDRDIAVDFIDPDDFNVQDGYNPPGNDPIVSVKRDHIARDL